MTVYDNTKLIKGEFKLINLEEYGFDSFYQKEYEKFRREGFEIARITAENKQRYNLITKFGEITGEVTGKFLFDADNLYSFPKTGDWVVITYFHDENKCIIHEVLNRKSWFSRGQAGKEKTAQVIAANIDYLFIVQSFNSDFNLNRIERYILMAEEGNCKPFIIMNKNDLLENSQEYLDIIKNRINAECFSISCETGNGFDNLKTFIEAGKTYAFVGSSGVGKSSIINILLTENQQKTNEIRIEDNKGRHTTTRREIFLIPVGGILIDTPGMREFSLWNNDISASDIFSDVSELAVECKFKDCSHTLESGCAVKSALQEGIITKEHLDNYFKLKKENDYLDSLIDKNSYLERKKKEKRLHREIKRFYKNGNSKRDL